MPDSDVLYPPGQGFKQAMAGVNKARVHIAPDDDYDATLTALLDQVKGDDEARQQFVDILELMGPHDPRTAAYRRKLTARLY